MSTSLASIVLATEGGIPYDSALARLSVPLGILVFLGGPYLLLRSNLGTLRAYLVIATSLFGLMIVQSLFWAFGAPGTPAATGPTNLPGQPANQYQATWIPFAGDSTIAQQDRFSDLVASPDQAFDTTVPADFVDEVETGVGDIVTFFSNEVAGEQVGTTWAVARGPFYAEAPDGTQVIFATYGPVYDADAEDIPEGFEVGDVVQQEAGGTNRYSAFAYYDPASLSFPALVYLALSVLGFAIHAPWLYADERRERREREEVAARAASEREQRVPANA